MSNVILESGLVKNIVETCKSWKIQRIINNSAIKDNFVMVMCRDNLWVRISIDSKMENISCYYYTLDNLNFIEYMYFGSYESIDELLLDLTLYQF